MRQDETSYKETKYGIVPRSKVIELEIAGTKNAFLFLQEKAQQNIPITSELIKKVHKEGYEDILMEDAGTFRTVQVLYSGKEAPHFSHIPELMHVLCNDINYAIGYLPDPSDDMYLTRVIELISRFQHRFVYIHPFVDYNGRVGRMFTNYILMLLDLPIFEIQVEKKQDRKKYIQALQKADDKDYSLFEIIIGEAFDESLKKVIESSA